MQKGKWTQYDKQKLHAVFIKWGDIFMNNEEAWGCICNDRKYRLWYIGMRPVNLHYNPTSNFNILNILFSLIWINVMTFNFKNCSAGTLLKILQGWFFEL